MGIKRHNNIEWLRLLFACQVMLVHGLHHFYKIDIFILNAFPGVPAFFFISGFLIYASYCKGITVSSAQKNGAKPAVVSYFHNRFLRLAPALIFVTIMALLTLIYFKGVQYSIEHSREYIIWFVAQITLGQAFNPDIFRDIGVGVINGSLWTITVEILFYLCVPIIVFLERSIKHLVYILCAGSFLVFWLGPTYLGFDVAMGKTMFEFLELTPIVWGWMFGLGIVAYKNIESINRHVSKFIFALIPLILLSLLNSQNVLFNAYGNTYGLVSFVLYAMLILYIAFGVKYIPIGFDLSYGVYIWHMVVINIMLELGVHNIYIMIIVVICIAFFSWYAIEKPPLALKKYSLQRK